MVCPVSDESVGSSNRIEGSKMSDKEVEELFNHIDTKSFQSRDEEEVAGYSDLIKLKNIQKKWYIFFNHESRSLKIL